MIVVRTRKKQAYIEALHQTDLVVGDNPGDGQIRPFLNYFKKLVQDELSNNIDFVTHSGTDAWWYDGERIKIRSINASKLLDFLQKNPYATYAEMSGLLGINVSAVQKLIKGMTDKGYLGRSEKEGNWNVFAFR